MSEEKIVSHLDMLASKLRALLAQEETNRQEWIRIQIDICKTLVAARDQFAADLEFGRWCESNGFDKKTLNHQVRAAAIAMGREPEALRKCLEATDRRSLQYIHKFDFARFTYVSKPPDDATPRRRRRNRRPSPITDAVREAVRPAVEAGEPISREQLQEQFGVTSSTVQKAVAAEEGRQEGLREAETRVEPIARDKMSPTMQQRYEAALRVARKEIEAEVTARLKAEIHAVWDGIIERYNERIKEAERIVSSQRGFMSRRDFRTLLACLHPDHNKFDDARGLFEIVKELEPILVKPDAKPINAPPLPTTVAELLALKKVRAGL
jgi:hypothetical protein